MNQQPMLILFSLLLGSMVFVQITKAADLPADKGNDNAPREVGDDPRDMYGPLRKFIPGRSGAVFNGPDKLVEGDPRAFTGPIGATPTDVFSRALNGVKSIPPAGVAVPAADRAELETGAADLAKEIESLRNDAHADLLPDVEIFYNAVHYALKYDEFFDAGQIDKARTLLKEGHKRAAELRDGKPGWVNDSGLVVRGYISKIDGSVQPYGLVIPDSVSADAPRKHRLDIWYHGRGETLNEINFLTERQKSTGDFTPKDTIVLHPYGRYCNANRFAGEVDTFEAIDSVKKHYFIDNDRILVRGFSMGGAACWMMATHHPDMWAAAAPGAGFSETADFLHIADLNSIPWYQRKMWNLYDSTSVAVNLYNIPVVAYSGELDGQKQAADMMVKAAKDVGIEFPYVIGIGAHHNYTPAAKEELNKRLDAIEEKGRENAAKHVKFATYSLKYNTMDWVTIDALEHHWDRATIDAEELADQTLRVTTRNVAAFTIVLPHGVAFAQTPKPQIVVDAMPFEGGPPPIDALHDVIVSFHKEGGKWIEEELRWAGVRKMHGLQGPIDDAFMDSFIMVSPTGKPMNDKTGAWVKNEEAHAIDAWRKQFRGEARVKNDSAVTDADIAGSNLVLWGDPSSNAVLAKIADKLPIKWNAQAVHVGDKTYPAASHVPVLIYPNPLNPRRYVVLNSGFTFREYDYENNARQTPKLPDWAIVDVDVPPSAKSPGGIPDAGFFGENWELTVGDHAP